MTSARPPELPTAASPEPQDRNRAAWMSIADFLARQNLRMVLAQLQRRSTQQEGTSS